VKEFTPSTPAALGEDLVFDHKTYMATLLGLTLDRNYTMVKVQTGCFNGQGADGLL
jgi:hypothetical protein